MRTIVACMLLAAASVAVGGGRAEACSPRVVVSFIEDSPDFFRIEFKHGPRFELKSVRIDLAPSRGKAYVDTAYGPAQGERQNGVALVSVSDVVEGGQRATLDFKDFLAGRSFKYFVDLDDRSLAADGDLDHLTHDEMLGATASARLIDKNGQATAIAGTFDKQGMAVLGPKACV